MSSHAQLTCLLVAWSQPLFLLTLSCPKHNMLACQHAHAIVPAFNLAGMHLHAKKLGKNGCGAIHHEIHTKSRHGFMYVSHATCLFVCLFPWLLYIQSFQASLSKAHTKNKQPSTSPLYSQKTAKMTCSKPITQLTQYLSKGHSHDRALSWE